MSNNPYDFSVNANSLEELWMPFTPNRQFKKNPRMITSADEMYYKDSDGRQILDCAAGLWCVNAGHNKQRIKDAINAQLSQLDFMHCFNMGHPTAFNAATKLTQAMPNGFNHVFFSNSGSEAVDTALKIALSYQRIRGKGTKRVLIGRERSYHGVNFGGMSVGGMAYVRTTFSQYLPAVDHLPHTYLPEKNLFARGEPEHGVELADHLERIFFLHDASNIAAVIIEPVAGATGVLPPPKGYLKRLRELCSKHDILLIFDEVVTGFGRVGYMSAGEYFDVMPDMIVTAKGLTNATIPMGATFVNDEIYNTFMSGAENVTELMHGYTYSGHPLACAAAIATLDVFEEEGILNHARSITQHYEDAAHSLKGYPYVTDIRNLGLLAAVQLQEWKPEDPYRIAREVSFELFRRGVFIRFNGINMIISPPLIMTKDHIDTMFTALGDVLHWAHKEFG